MGTDKVTQRYGKIRRGIHLARAISSLFKMGAVDESRELVHQASKEPATTYISVLETLRKSGLKDDLTKRR